TRRARARYLHLKVLAEPPPPGFERRELGVVARLPLSDEDTMWRRLPAKTRTDVRRGQKSGFELRGGRAELPHYYDVLADNYHRLGTPIYGFAVMSELVTALGSRAEVLTLWRDGRAASGALLVFHRGVLTVPFASSRRSVFALKPNNLLYWEIIRLGC